MTATLEDGLRALRAEGAAARPAPYRNPRRDYLQEIEEARAGLAAVEEEESE